MNKSLYETQLIRLWKGEKIIWHNENINACVSHGEYTTMTIKMVMPNVYIIKTYESVADLNTYKNVCGRERKRFSAVRDKPECFNVYLCTCMRSLLKKLQLMRWWERRFQRRAEGWEKERVGKKTSRSVRTRQFIVNALD